MLHILCVVTQYLQNIKNLVLFSQTCRASQSCLTFVFLWLPVSVFLLKSWNKSLSASICRGRLEESCCVSRRSERQLPIPRSLFSPCICQSRPHLPLHAAWYAPVLYQSRWQCLCLPACYWSQPRSGCLLSAHFRAGGGVYRRATCSLMSREGGGKLNVTSEEFDWLSARAPRWTDAAIKQAPLSLRCMLCTSATVSLNLQRGTALTQSQYFTFFCHFEAWEKKVFAYLLSSALLHLKTSRLKLQRFN